jgi:REP element-mobilizing transposase RayT
MARPPRIFHEGAIYHVFARGNRRESIFYAPGHYRRFLRILHSVWDDSDFSVLAYCLMPNHFHLAVRAGAQPLGKPMQRLLSTYARMLNREAARLGHVFERRYHALAVAKPHYLQALVRYIHLNPVRAGLSTDPQHYRWSSHGAYLAGGGPAWLDRSTVLAAFGTPEASAPRRFARYVGHPEDPAEYGEIALPPPPQSRRRTGTEPTGGGRGFVEGPCTSATDLDTLIAIAADIVGASAAQVIGGRDRRASLGRALVASMIQCSQGVSLSDLSRRCGRSMPALSNAGRRLRESPARAPIWNAYRSQVARRTLLL